MTSKEGTTLCLNLDIFLLFSPLLRSLLTISGSSCYSSFLPRSPHLFLPETSFASLMALESLLCKGVSKTGELAEVLETAAQMGIEIDALVADTKMGATARMEGGGENDKITSNVEGMHQNDNQTEVCNVAKGPLPGASEGENGQKRKSNDGSAGNDVETEMLKQVASSPARAMQIDNTVKKSSISTTTAQQAMDRVMNAGASKDPFPASAMQVDAAIKEGPSVVAHTSGGVMSVEVYGEEEEDEEENEKKRAMFEVKSEPIEVELGADHLQGQGAGASAADNANIANLTVAPAVNIANIALAANIISSEKRKESPASVVDEVMLKKKKLLDTVLQNMSDKKSITGGESKGSNNAAKHSKLKRKASDTSSKPSDISSKAPDKNLKVANKAVKGGGDQAASQQGRRGSISSTTGQQAMDRVMNPGASKTIKSVGENTSVKIASSTLMSIKDGGASTDASRRKSEPSSTVQASLFANGKPRASKLSTQGRKKQTKADPSDLKSLQSKKVLTSSSSMEILPGLTITPNPNIAAQPQLINSNSPILPALSVPVLSNHPLPPTLSANAPALAPAAAEAAVDEGPAAAVNQNEVVSQGGKVEKIPQKVAGVQAGEDEKGCNYSLTCELCQKENKTLQALYTHVIVHIRVELERKVKDLMEGFQCKVLGLI